MNVNQHCSRIQDIQDELDELRREQMANIARNVAHVNEQEKRNAEQRYAILESLYDDLYYSTRTVLVILAMEGHRSLGVQLAIDILRNETAGGKHTNDLR